MPSETLLKYNPLLDGLRFFAVLLVLIAHWVPSTSVLNALPNGAIGVTLFFVLSGYLITSILLGFKTEILRGHNTVLGGLGHFYLRRTLRIFPIYYLTLLGLYLLPDVTGTSIRDGWPIYALFLQNFWMYSRGEFDGILGHFWTLAVEEQFYLLWGPAVLALSFRRLWWVAGTMIGIGLFTHVAGYALYQNGIGSALYFVLTPACFDGFAMGAVLALLIQRAPGRATVTQNILGIIGLGFLGGVLAARSMDAGASELLAHGAIVACGGYVILGLITGRAPGWLRRLLGFRPFVIIGKMSYGMYVYHNLVPHLGRSLESFLAKRGLAPDWLIFLLAEQGSAKYVVWTAALLGMSYISWRFIESPINDLKARFGYETNRKAREAARSAA